jgi:hypothetical protein
MKPITTLNKIKFSFAKPKHPKYRKIYGFDEFFDKCCIAFCDTVFCDFENITRSSDKVYIGHFSVAESFRGARIGEKCLRKFAAHIARLDPNINTIEFSLHRLPTKFNHQKVGQERLRLLNQVGATNTSITAVGNGEFQVDGSWDKSRWQ